jgi:predicted TIM-barrel fold metal-dependent hydrolase
MCALVTFGADRIMYSIDYPYSSNVAGKKFFDLLPVSPADRIKIAHGNADRVLKLNPPPA